MEASNIDSNTIRNRVISISKKVLIVFAFFTLFLFIVDKFWTMSGSNEWELKKDKDGVKVYSLKVPGDRIVKFKTIIQGSWSLSQMAALHLVDDNLETCKDWFPNCVEFKRIMEFDSVKLYDVDLWVLASPPPFADRELLLRTIVSQDEESKVVTLDVIGSPTTLPVKKGRIRVQQMHAKWQFTSIGNGKSELELIQNLSMGGLIPYFLLNMFGADENFKFMRDELPKFLEKEKYKNAKFCFIEEQDELYK